MAVFAVVRMVGSWWQSQVENALQLNLPNVAQSDDFIVAMQDGLAPQFVSSVDASGGGADV